MTLVITQIQPTRFGEPNPRKVSHEVDFDLIGSIESGKTLIQKDPRDWTKYEEDAFAIPHNGRIEIRGLEMQDFSSERF